MSTEAYYALEHGGAAIEEFLGDTLPGLKDLENRQEAYLLASGGSPEVRRAAEAALDSDDPDTLAAFIAYGQLDALAVDQRAEAFNLSSSGGPEMQAAANIALEGSNADLRAFLERGRFEAEKRDNATAAHVAQMQSMLQLADSQAAASRQAAAKAAEAAAIARNAAAEAQASAAKAERYAQQAQNWAAQAAESANQATASENQAKQSQQKAHQALTQAIADAKVASSSAARATASAQQAQGYAADAAGAAARAAQSATNAGLSAAAAAQAATDAQNIAAMKQREEDGERNYVAPPEQRSELTQEQIDAAYAAGGDAEVQKLKEAHALTQPNAFIDMIVKEGGQLLLDVLGVTDIMNCVTKGDFGACVMSIIGFAPWGKVAKLLGAIPLIAKIGTKILGFGERVEDALAIVRRNDGLVQDATPPVLSGEKIIWTSWPNYPKVTVNGTEYAQVGDRLYTHHAVDYLQPSSLGIPKGAMSPGRSISPNYVEYVLRDATPTPAKPGKNGEPRLSYVSGSVEVITENGLVVTVNPFSGGK